MKIVMEMAKEEEAEKKKFVVYVVGQAIYGETREKATEEARKYAEGL